MDGSLWYRQRGRMLGWALAGVNAVGVLLALRTGLFVAAGGAFGVLAAVLLSLLWSGAALVAGCALINRVPWGWPWAVCWAVLTIAQTLAAVPTGAPMRVVRDLVEWWQGVEDPLNFSGPRDLTIIASWILALAVVQTVASQSTPADVPAAPRSAWIASATGASLLMLAWVLL